MTARHRSDPLEPSVHTERPARDRLDPPGGGMPGVLARLARGRSADAANPLGPDAGRSRSRRTRRLLHRAGSGSGGGASPSRQSRRPARLRPW